MKPKPRRQSGDFAVDGHQVRLGDRIDRCTGLIGPGSEIEKTADIVDIEAEIAGVADEEQSP
jgi:hypothetical protein